MKFTAPKRIIVEDFPSSEQETISKLGFIINSVFEQVGQMFNKNLNITDNLNESIIDVPVVVDAQGIPTSRTQFRYTLKGQCKGLIVMSATNSTSLTTYPMSQPFITFEQLPSGLINIKHVSGIQAQNKYSLTIRVVGS